MKNIYHSDIYQFNTPVSSYWEDHSSENLNLDKLNKDISSEIVVIGGGYTGLSCAINLIENHNLDVILVEAGKIGWGASSRNAGFCCLPPSKMSFKKMQSIYGIDETKKFFKKSVEGSNYTRDIIKEYNIDCDITGDSNYVVAHHPNKFKDIQEQATAYKEEFGIETEIYSKEDFDKIGHGGTEQFGAFSYKPGFAINPLKFVNGIAKYALSKKLKIFEHTKVNTIDKDKGAYILRTKEGSIRSKKIKPLPHDLPAELISSLRRLGDLVQRQLKDVLDAYLNKSKDSAIKIWKTDEKVDDLTHAAMNEVADFLGQDKKNLDLATHLLFVTKNIERAGDHITNIAESLFYLIEGEHIEGARPKGKDFDPS